MFPVLAFLTVQSSSSASAPVCQYPSKYIMPKPEVTVCMTRTGQDNHLLLPHSLFLHSQVCINFFARSRNTMTSSVICSPLNRPSPVSGSILTQLPISWIFAVLYLNLRAAHCKCRINTPNRNTLSIPLEWPSMVDASECVFQAGESRQPGDSFLVYEKHVSTTVPMAPSHPMEHGLYKALRPWVLY